MQSLRVDLKNRGSVCVFAHAVFMPALILPCLPIPAQAEKAFEQRAELQASSQISPELLKSDLYTVGKTR